MCTIPNYWRCTVEVGIRQLRDDLRHWLDVVGDGGEVVITERGRPIARLSGVASREPLERLIAAGIVTRAEQPRRRDSDHSRVKSDGPVSELVSEQRR
ncbi:MAG: type II toxin-antitoxin system prevent-host-death family antitoxin [Solirubrobacterales bacterium]|nr:type II toxin-antitoxin system prevent-host-death family antitoxin [Solirubrobacterales bacterium]